MLGARSSSSSPVRKRQRLSSPTYEDQVQDLTQEDLAAFDALEARLSQERPTSREEKPDEDVFGAGSGKPVTLDWGNALSQSQSQAPSSSYPSFAPASRTFDLPDDPDNPFTHASTSSAAAAPSHHPPVIGFASASKLALDRNYDRSPSPEEPPHEPDYESWFQPAPDIPIAFAVPAFTKASAATAFSKASTAVPGFTKASSSSIIMPSEMALARAKAKLDAWEKEDPSADENDENATRAPSFPAPISENQAVFQRASAIHEAHSPKRPALSALPNVLNTPNTPTPMGFSRPTKEGPSKTVASSILPQRPAAFKSPLQKSVHTTTPANLPGSPLNPKRPASSVGFTSASGNPHPLAGTPFTAPMPAYNAAPRTSVGSVTPLRASTPASVLRTRPAKFVTPFKANMKPGELGRLGLPSGAIAKTPQKVVETRTAYATPLLVQPHPKTSFFSLTSSPDRQTLASCGLQPQQYEDDDLESMGINVSMLNQITPETALYYSFHTASSLPPTPGSEPSAVLGPAAALAELLKRGCNLATKPWVDNHWCLILWKLAGMVALDPEKEAIPEQKRWCWNEVMRQLLYRYERELNTGVRPPLRKIANQDAPAAFPMVLCISNLFWSPRGVTEDGLPIEPHPELEVTDGWYRLRAQVDEPMARAARKGFIRVGRKIGFAGAKLSSERKDPSEVLEAYNSTKLILYGNSSHLMPWHAKLGFMKGPCISTLHSLTGDGGVVTALDFVILKVHPVAFLEFVMDEDGKKRREGPRLEAEELQVNEEWKRRRDIQASKLRDEFDKKHHRYEGYIHRLETKAGRHFKPTEDDYPPDGIEALYDQLEYPDTASEVITRITPVEAGWLALHTRKQADADREMIGEEMEKEMNALCPPREVRSFRLLIVQDARTLRKPAHRTAHLTVWDVMALTLDEGSSAGTFIAGHRYLATNLLPTQASAWMDCQPGSEVYLSTRRDTRWTRIKLQQPDPAQ